MKVPPLRQLPGIVRDLASVSSLVTAVSMSLPFWLVVVLHHERLGWWTVPVAFGVEAVFLVVFGVLHSVASPATPECPPDPDEHRLELEHATLEAIP
jgi:hypothetical protein